MYVDTSACRSSENDGSTPTLRAPTLHVALVVATQYVDAHGMAPKAAANDAPIGAGEAV